jgi:hypothetical protein
MRENRLKAEPLALRVMRKPRLKAEPLAMRVATKLFERAANDLQRIRELGLTDGECQEIINELGMLRLTLARNCIIVMHVDGMHLEEEQK